MNKKRICFISNPVSGSGIGRYFRKTRKMKGKFINRFLDTSRFEYEIFYTEDSGHAKALCEQAVAEEFDIIAAVGGDGTVNEVAGVLIGTSIPLAIIPAGSGNGFSRHLKIPMHLRGALNVINKGRIIQVDTAVIQPAGGGEGTHFICTAGLAFDAFMAEKFKSMAKRGFWEYIKITAKEVFSYESMEYHLNIDGKERQHTAYVLTFANSSQYGNNAVVAPGASVEDGLLEVCVVEKFPMYKVWGLVFRLFTRSIDRSPLMQIIQAREVTVRRELDHVQIDGDFIHLNKHVRVAVNPRSLHVVAM